VNDESSRHRVDGSRLSPRSPSEAIQPEPVPPPPPSRQARSILVVAFSGFFSFLFLLVIGAGVALYAGMSQFDSRGPLEEPLALQIPRGEGTLALARMLEREGVIDNAWIFLAGVAVNNARGQLKAGEYLFPEHASMRDVLALLLEGRSIFHQVTVPEGWTSHRIVARLRANDTLVGEIESVPPEGSLLPETYRFTRGTTRQQMINRMQRAQQRVLQEIWERRIDGLPIESPEELVILASIVEKETGRADERPRIAGVFMNRLQRGMRLQSDPTILYGLYGGQAFDRPRTITRAELDAPNEYSTYQIHGLPPTPIANPGRAAMEAVANPSRTDELYFVADGTGGHTFARTLEQHNRNVARWREIERARRERAAQESDEEDASAAPDDDGEAAEQGAAAGSLRGINLNTQ
jgi:UPF0755 protein